MYSLRVVNRALRALGEPPVDTLEDMDEAPSAVVKLLNDYDTIVGAVLKKIGRGEFIAYATLSPLIADGDWNFPYRYQMPADGLVFLDPETCGEMEMAIETVAGVDQHVIKAKANGALNLAYVRRVNLDLLADEVIEALGLNLAAMSAYQITQQRDWSDRVEQKAKTAISEARAVTAGSTEVIPRRSRRMGWVRGGARG